LVGGLRYVMLRKVKLYGKLAKFVGQRVFEVDVHTAAEAVQFLIANWPALEQHMANQHYKVEVGSSALTLEETVYPIGSDDISITPVIAGAGNTGRIILGVALVATAFATGGFTLGAGAGQLGLSGFKAASGVGMWAAGGAGWAMAGNIGLLLVLSGVAGLLTPTPTTPKSEEDPQNQFSFSGIQQTGRAGTAIPVCYGEVLTGSVVISAGIDVTQN